MVLGFIITPSFSLAAPPASDLESYLAELGWTEEQLAEHLDFLELAISDFSSVEEIEELLGPVLTEELLQELLEWQEITLEELTALLIENGELEVGQSIFDAYKFYYDLEFDVYFYNLTPITDESLQTLLDQYELTLEELIALLEEHDDSLENYEYIEDLEWAIDLYLYGSDLEFADISELFSLIGLTDVELERLFNHFDSLDYTNPAFLEKLEELSERMIAFEDFEDPADVTPEQIAELLDIFTQLLDLFELDVKFFLVKDQEKKPISLHNLMMMDSTDGYGLLIKLYNKKGEFLADLLFTADLFGPEVIIETGKDLKTIEDTIVNKSKDKDKVKDKTKPVKKTVKGAKLPKTASNYLTNAATGVAIAAVGFFFYRRFKVNHG